MSNQEKLPAIIGILFMGFLLLVLVVVLYFSYKDQKEVENFKIPSGYCLVKYDEDNFVIMDSARTKFLVFWDDDSYSMEKNMGNLKDNEIQMKRHLINYLEEEAKKEQKIKFQEKVKNNH